VSVQDVIEARAIEEVVHFTWHRGLMGALHSGFVKSRQRLPNAAELEFIYEPNSVYRKDLAWLDYVNLSISRINGEFFGHSCRWHRDKDLWWCVLSFDPIILTHPGVWFATTNNIYPAVRRATGSAGLETLFADTVLGRYSAVLRRNGSTPTNHTTCEQAEVLYPGELSLEYLRRIYVSTGEDCDEVRAQLAAIRWRPVDVIIAPDRLGGRTGH
jgi:ssDNA thymidine ADP-ribosyltransferase, DarT